MMMIQAPSATRGGARTTPVVVIGDERWRDIAEQAIDAGGGRLAAIVGWDHAADTLSQHAACAMLMVETGGTSAEVLADVLPRVDAFAAALDLPVIVTLEERSIDVVAAAMLNARAQLLCEPTAFDRGVAVAVAAGTGAALVSDTVREGEAARLQRLNDEVSRIAETLARLTRRGAEERIGVPVVTDRPMPFLQRPESDIVIDAAEVRRAIRGRRLRDQHFGSGLFEDPAWDIILDLFAAELENVQVSVSSLCIAASVAPTTALRWIAKLTDGGLLERRPDPFDRRRAFMELSSSASQAMREHVAALRRAGLPFG